MNEWEKNLAPTILASESSCIQETDHTAKSCQGYLMKILAVIYRRDMYRQCLHGKCSLTVKTGKNVLQNFILNKINRKESFGTMSIM